jgi:hypothetical protein
VAGRGETDGAARRAAIAAKYEARCSEIEVAFQEYVEAFRVFDEDMARGVPPLALMPDGRWPPSLEEAEGQRDQLLREAREDYLQELQVLTAELGLVEDERRETAPAPEAGEGRGTDPFKRATFDKAVRLLAEGTDVREVAKQTGLSRHRVDKIETWRLGGRGGRVYDLESRPLANTVILRLRRNAPQH